MTVNLATSQQQNIIIPFLYIRRSGKSTSALSHIHLTPYHLKNYQSSDSDEMSKNPVTDAHILITLKGGIIVSDSLSCNKTTANHYNTILIHDKKWKINISNVSYTFHTIPSQKISLE